MPRFQTATHVDSQTWVSGCIHDPTTRQLEIANPVRPCNKTTNAAEASISVTGPLGSQQRLKHFSLFPYLYHASCLTAAVYSVELISSPL